MDRKDFGHKVAGLNEKDILGINKDIEVRKAG